MHGSYVINFKKLTNFFFVLKRLSVDYLNIIQELHTIINI